MIPKSLQDEALKLGVELAFKVVWPETPRDGKAKVAPIQRTPAQETACKVIGWVAGCGLAFLFVAAALKGS